MKRFLTVLVCLLMLCSGAIAAEMGNVYLYGEQHNQKVILEKELELWEAHYQAGMRHLFVELPYYTAQFLNLWMQVEEDTILEALYADWEGTAVYSRQIVAFYRQIKMRCPDTIFHGTDVGHQYNTTGQRFVQELEKNGLTDSVEWQLALACIEQGKRYYNDQDAVYRENQMVENFSRAWEAIDFADGMGIYGSAHTGLQSLDHSGQVPCMAAQLAEKYGERIHSEDLTELLKRTAPLEESAIELNGKYYTAQFFGTQDVSGFSNLYVSRDFWKLENAYEDFQGLPRTGDVLPYNNYPTPVEVGDAFVIDYTTRKGETERMLYIAFGGMWNGMPVTEGIVWK